MGRREDERLRRAILAYDLQTAEALLDGGADPNVVIGKRRGKSPSFRSFFAPHAYRALHLAAYDDDVELAALLLLRGADPHAKIYQGVLPISIAAKHNHLATAELLLHEYRRPSGPFAYCPLSMAAHEGHLEMVDLLLAKRPECMGIDAALQSALSKKENLAVTKRLLAAGADGGYLSPGAGEPPTTARTIALRAQPEALPLLRGHTQHRLMDAAIDGDVAAVLRFLDAGASPDDASPHGYECALTGASRGGHLEVVRTLVDRGASLRGPQNKAEPLMAALRGAHTEVADFLRSLGSRARDMSVRSILYRLPLTSIVWAVDAERVDPGLVLFTAARVPRIEVARFALGRGADPSHRVHGRSSLMIAASRGALELVELLIAEGADLTARDPEGQSALHYAVAINDMDDPEDPFEYEPSGLDRPVARLLRDHGLTLEELD